jgi:hypothetical protein
VHDEEVDFGAVEGLFPHAEVDGDGGDEGDEFAGCGGADADVPFFFPAWRFECPDYFSDSFLESWVIAYQSRNDFE